MRHRRFHVLMVCTANQCRSPMAEQMLTVTLERLRLDDNWWVSSAGVNAVDGRPAHPLTRRVMNERGTSLESWTSCRLTADAVDDADLILTAEADHRRQVVTMAPRAVNRTFPLLQFAALAQLTPPVHALRSRAGPELVAAISQARDHLQTQRGGAYDLADPVGRRIGAFRLCADRTAEAISTILAPLRIG